MAKVYFTKAIKGARILVRYQLIYTLRVAPGSASSSALGTRDLEG